MPLSVRVSESIAGVTLEYALSISDEALKISLGDLPDLEEISDSRFELDEALHVAALAEVQSTLAQARPRLLPCLLSALVSYLASDLENKKAPSSGRNTADSVGTDSVVPEGGHLLQGKIEG